MKKISLYLACAYLVLLFLSISILMIFFPEKIAEQNISQVLLDPSFSHPFGTDSLGRDLLARVLGGGFVSLTVGLVGTAIAAGIGVCLGALAGQVGGWVDRLLMRFCDIFMAVPGFVLVAVFSVLFTDIFTIENSFTEALVCISLSIGLTHWMQITRITRGKVLEIKARPFIEAAVALGATKLHVFVKHLIPNMLGTLLVLIATQIPGNIIYESFLSFVGLGMQPPDTSWGVLIREGWKSLASFPHLVLYPSMTLFMTVWSIHICLDRIKNK